MADEYGDACPVRREPKADAPRDGCEPPAASHGRIMDIRSTDAGDPRCNSCAATSACSATSRAEPSLISATPVRTSCRRFPIRASSAARKRSPERECALRARTGGHRSIAPSARWHTASPVDYLVGRLKYQRDLRIVPALAGLLLRSVAPGTGTDWLAPVPIAAPRLRKRGFNQALELARVVSSGTGVPITEVVRRRRGADTPQSSLPDTSARRANVADAFVARAGTSGCVAIVDDVVTTAATVNAIARCLKGAGANRVVVWAVARTP